MSPAPPDHATEADCRAGSSPGTVIVSYAYARKPHHDPLTQIPSRPPTLDTKTTGAATLQADFMPDTPDTDIGYETPQGNRASSHRVLGFPGGGLVSSLPPQDPLGRACLTQ